MKDFTFSKRCYMLQRTGFMLCNECPDPVCQLSETERFFSYVKEYLNKQKSSCVYEPFEYRVSLDTTISSSKEEDLSSSEIEEVRKELASVFCLDLSSVVCRRRYEICDCEDPESIHFEILLPEMFRKIKVYRAFVHVCITDPQDLEAIVFGIDYD